MDTEFATVDQRLQLQVNRTFLGHSDRHQATNTWTPNPPLRGKPDREENKRENVNGRSSLCLKIIHLTKLRYHRCKEALRHWSR